MEAAKAARTCPGCESAMQVYFVAEVELDRCQFCGGLWFDRGELQSVTGKVLDVEPFSGHTTRRCAYCTLTLKTALIGSTPAEVCGSCLGTYLDDGELDELAGRKVPLERRAPLNAQQAKEKIEYQCCGCGQVLKLHDGFVTPRGVSCGRCYGAMDFGGGVPTTTPNRLAMEENVDLLVPSVITVAIEFLFS